MRLFGVMIPDNKRLDIGLTTLYGVGRNRAQKILADTAIDRSKRPKGLTEVEVNKITKALEVYVLEGDLRREIGAHIKRLKDIKTYRGSRHAKHLPVRGQRTKVNSRTVRGNVRRTMGSGKRKVDKK